MTTYRLAFTFFIVLTLTAPAGADDCQRAEELTRQAFDLGENPDTFAEQKRLLARALDACPASANAHNLLGSVLEAEGAYEEALSRYQEAARLRPDFAAAWYGVGEIYYATGRLPLALDAYLRACRTDDDARARIADLLRDNRYQRADEGEILDAESLGLLFDRERRAEMQALLDACRTRSGDDFGFRGVVVEAAADFPNILFDLGEATLKPPSLRQIEAIGAALRQQPDGVRVIVNGHTDAQPFAAATSADENSRLNMALSEERAAAVARQLIQLGVAGSRLETRGYGFSQPLIDADTPAAYAANRRVSLEVSR